MWLVYEHQPSRCLLCGGFVVSVPENGQGSISITMFSMAHWFCVLGGRGFCFFVINVSSVRGGLWGAGRGGKSSSRNHPFVTLGQVGPRFNTMHL